MSSWNPVLLALLATLFTWGLTALGAATVFLGRNLKPKTFDGTLGFAAGVMIAASFWSLLAPSIEMSEELGYGAFKWMPPLLGFLLGGLFLWGMDKVLPHLHPGFTSAETEGIKTHWQRSVLLVLAITLHNIPEGLSVGVAIGAAAAHGGPEALWPALALTLGIGIQNFPEGLAVSMPLRAAGFSRRKSFFVGQASGLVEPVAAVIGAAAVVWAQALLPYALSFAAGAMLFVTVEELIPESQSGDHGDIATLGFVIGFALMMFLDVSLG